MLIRYNGLYRPQRYARKDPAPWLPFHEPMPRDNSDLLANILLILLAVFLFLVAR